MKNDKDPLWKITIDDGFHAYTYTLDIGKFLPFESIDRAYQEIRRIYGDRDRSKQAKRVKSYNEQRMKN